MRKICLRREKHEMFKLVTTFQKVVFPILVLYRAMSRFRGETFGKCEQ